MMIITGGSFSEAAIKKNLTELFNNNKFHVTGVDTAN